jgi:hypothetical protein
MSYKNVIDSNINMLKKAEIMYQNDLKNLALNRGKNIDDYENEQIMKAIQDKLNMLRNQKKLAMHEKINKYQSNSKILQAIYDDNYKSDLMIRKQAKEIDYNSNKLNDVKNDIITLRRQVEISQNETLKRNNRLFLLKSLFVYLLILILPILLIKNNNISNSQGLISIGAITGLFILVVLYNFYKHRNINNIHYDVTNWESPTIKDVIGEEKDDQL